MMNEVTTFQYQSHEFRSVQNGEDILFVAKDVCEALELSDVSMSCQNLPDEEKLIQTLFVSGQSRDMLCVTESGLYRLIFRSNKPEAEKFRRWVFNDVLPAIRKTGSYSTANSQTMETIVSQVVALVLPAVLDKVMPISDRLEEKLDQTRSDFSHYSSVSGFYHLFCRPAGRNVFVYKDKLYDIYRQFCEARGAKPFAKPYFCGKLYRAVTGCSASDVTVNGRRIPAIRGIELLAGWPTIMIDIKRAADERAARELANRRKYYFGIEPGAEGVN